MMLQALPVPTFAPPVVRTSSLPQVEMIVMTDDDNNDPPCPADTAEATLQLDSDFSAETRSLPSKQTLLSGPGSCQLSSVLQEPWVNIHP